MLRAIVAAFSFLTQIPVWRGPLRDVDLGRSVGFFPLVGFVIYMVARPKGGLVPCPNCKQSKLDVLLKCPHCSADLGPGAAAKT